MDLKRPVGDTTLSLALVPMQFTDNAKQKRKDAKKIFKELGDCDIIAGTEAGEEPLRTFLREEATRRGYAFRVVEAHWIAIKKSIISPRRERQGFAPLIKATQGFGRHGLRGLLWWTFVHVETGEEITIAAGHYLTHGGAPGTPNWEMNAGYARQVGRIAKEKAKGHASFFFLGDTNTNDRKFDAFHGEPLTSCWDELQKWPTTVEDNATIDVIASYDKDRRAKCERAFVLDDSKIRLNVDHFVSRADYTISARPKIKLS